MPAPAPVPAYAPKQASQLQAKGLTPILIEKAEKQNITFGGILALVNAVLPLIGSKDINDVINRIIDILYPSSSP